MTEGCTPCRVDGRAAGRPIASRRKFRRLRQSCGWNLVLPRGTCWPKTEKLGGNPLHTEPVLQLKVERVRKRHVEPLSPFFAGYIAQHGSRLLHGQGNLWKKTWRSYGRYECDFGYLGECSWIPLFEQQFISEKTMTRI